MSFESFRCMDSSEDTKEEGPANCQYPKCWIGTCPHKQARDRLSEVEKLIEKWRVESDKKSGYYEFKDGESYGLGNCADELEKALGGGLDG